MKLFFTQRVVLPLIITIFFNLQLFSQNLGEGTFTVGGYFATDSILPFFLRTNQFGIVPQKSNFLTLRANYYQDYDSTKFKSGLISEWGWGYGASLAANIGKESKFYLQEAYLKGRWRGLELYVGRRKEIFGLVDTLMTSGSYIWSGNALPMPKVQFATPGYLNLTQNAFLGIKFGITHGWFGDQGYVRNYWLHQKWLYLRVGKPLAAVQFYGGFNHQVQWGGQLATVDPLDPFAGKLTPYPWYTYPYLLIPFLQKFYSGDPTKATAWDNGLAPGNQLGSIDILFDVDTDFGLFKIYKQQPYDFGRSIKNFTNIEDGLYGISLKTGEDNISNIIFEFFYSKSQGLYRFGKYMSQNKGEFDDYFFHGQYEFWAYNAKIIGTPYILATNIEQTELKFNNRLKYFYIGLKGKLDKLNYQIKFVNSYNYGVYFKPPIYLTQFSSNILLKRKIKEKQFVSLELSSDFGTLYPNVFGIYANYSISF